MKEKYKDQILSLIRAEPQKLWWLSRIEGDLLMKTGVNLSIPTVSKIVRELASEGLLELEEFGKGHIIAVRLKRLKEEVKTK